MDIRKLSIEERNCPYQMAKHFITQNDTDYYERIRFLDKSYNLSEVKNIVNLCKLFNRDEVYISKILNAAKIKEIEDVELLINEAVYDLKDKITSDKREYYLKELNSQFENSNESSLDNVSIKFLENMENEFLNLRNGLQDKKNSSLFFDNINKMVSCIQLSSIHIIKNKNLLRPDMLKNKNIFTGLLLNNKMLKSLNIENNESETLTNDNKLKLDNKNKNRRARKLKLN